MSHSSSLQDSEPACPGVTAHHSFTLARSKALQKLDLCALLIRSAALCLVLYLVNDAFKAAAQLAATALLGAFLVVAKAAYQQRRNALLAGYKLFCMAMTFAGLDLLPSSLHELAELCLFLRLVAASHVVPFLFDSLFLQLPMLHHAGFSAANLLIWYLDRPATCSHPLLKTDTSRQQLSSIVGGVSNLTLLAPVPFTLCCAVELEEQSAQRQCLALVKWLQFGCLLVVTMLLLLLERHAWREFASRQCRALPSPKRWLCWCAADEQVEWQLVGLVLPAAVLGLWLLLGQCGLAACK